VNVSIPSFTFTLPLQGISCRRIQWQKEYLPLATATCVFRVLIPFDNCPRYRYSVFHSRYNALHFEKIQLENFVSTWKLQFVCIFVSNDWVNVEGSILGYHAGNIITNELKRIFYCPLENVKWGLRCFCSQTSIYFISIGSKGGQFGTVPIGHRPTCAHVALNPNKRRNEQCQSRFVGMQVCRYASKTGTESFK